MNYIDSLENIKAENIIVLDESGSDLKQTSEYARVEGGKRAKAEKPFNPGCRYSIIGAISINAVIAAMYTDTSINGEIFETFIEKILLPKLKPGQFLVMDNVSPIPSF